MADNIVYTREDFKRFERQIRAVGVNGEIGPEQVDHPSHQVDDLPHKIMFNVVFEGNTFIPEPNDYFRHPVSEILSALEQWRRTHDKNGDGQISYDELHPLHDKEACDLKFSSAPPFIAMPCRVYKARD